MGFIGRFLNVIRWNVLRKTLERKTLEVGTLEVLCWTLTTLDVGRKTL